MSPLTLLRERSSNLLRAAGTMAAERVHPEEPKEEPHLDTRLRFLEGN